MVQTRKQSAAPTKVAGMPTNAVLNSIRTEIFTGRPMRVRKNPLVMKWETEKREEKQKLLASGVIPVT